MNNNEKAMLAQLLSKYQAEKAQPQPQPQPQPQQANVDSVLLTLLSQGYAITPPQLVPPAPTPPTDTVSQIIAGLQASNVMNIQQPHVETVDDILASIIAPDIPEYGNEPNGGK